MNALALECLEAIWRDATSRQKHTPDHFELQLQLARQFIMEGCVDHLACRLWAIHDEAQLQAWFDAQQEFSYDPAELEEPWAMAFQMAIMAFELNPPPMPEYTEAEVKEWLVEKASKPKQLLLV